VSCDHLAKRDELVADRARIPNAIEEIPRLIPTYRLEPDLPPEVHGGYVRGVDRLQLVVD
jgi:hypothetical protein